MTREEVLTVLRREFPLVRTEPFQDGAKNIVMVTHDLSLADQSIHRLHGPHVVFILDDAEKCPAESDLMIRFVHIAKESLRRQMQ